MQTNIPGVSGRSNSGNPQGFPVTPAYTSARPLPTTFPL